MSIYYEAEPFLSSQGASGSDNSDKYSLKALKSRPAQVYAVVVEAIKWSPVLKEVIENSSLLSHERKLSPSVAVLLAHDLLINKKGISASAAHPLRLSIERHKARLTAEFTKARIRRGCPSVDELRKLVEEEALNTRRLRGDGDGGALRPRWIRVNRVKSSTAEQLSTTFKDFKQAASLKEVFDATCSTQLEILYLDTHVPDLIAIPGLLNPTIWPAYRDGELIIQDKASCFPAHFLDPKAEDGDILDACAAPGNKTTHLASLMRLSGLNSRIWAIERDEDRAKALQKMIHTAGADRLVSVKGGQDFLKISPEDQIWSKVGALLLDPSCSGSGIYGREERLHISLPERPASQQSVRNSKKRKREADKTIPLAHKVPDAGTGSKETADEALAARLKSLSALQTKLLVHAFEFPNARKVTYSTCSIYPEENESVVIAALNSPAARLRGWRLLRREEQVEGLRRWEKRGISSACPKSSTQYTTAEACIRCDKFTSDGTQGFFLAGFVRDLHPEDSPSDEWTGFDSD